MISVVTGSNSGIGKVIAGELARRGDTVVMVARRRDAGEAAAAEVRRDATGEVLLELADLSLAREVRGLAERLRARFDRIDVLVNNAGLYLPKRRITDEGHEFTFAVNHLAPFALTNLLRDRLAAAGSARVVTTASNGHRFARFDLDDLMMERRWFGLRQYGNGKLANILFTAEAARRFAGDGIRVNCFHPGAVATGFGQDEAGVLNGLMKVFGKTFLRTPARGADTGVYLATSPEVAEISGEYFVDRKVARPARQARDAGLAARLWDRSVELTQAG